MWVFSWYWLLGTRTTSGFLAFKTWLLVMLPESERGQLLSVENMFIWFWYTTFYSSLSVSSSQVHSLSLYGLYHKLPDSSFPTSPAASSPNMADFTWLPCSSTLHVYAAKLLGLAFGVFQNLASSWFIFYHIHFKMLVTCLRPGGHSSLNVAFPLTMLCLFSACNSHQCTSSKWCSSPSWLHHAQLLLPHRKATSYCVLLLS